MAVLIVGGGIAGFTTAIALARQGVATTVLEARPEAGAGGAFLTLAPNGVNALRDLGLGELPSIAGGFAVTGIDMYNARGRRIGEVPGESDERHFGAPSVVLRRAPLLAQLERTALADGVELRYGATTTAVAEHDDAVHVTLHNGTTLEAERVIGADGIWSRVRRSIWPSAPVPSYSGIVDCGGWARVDLPDTPRQQMTFGARAFFGYTVHDSVAYWFTNVPVAAQPARGEFDRIDPHRWMSRVRELHSDAADPIRHILEATTAAVGAWPLYDLRSLPAWATDRVCLVGDAAHATNPSTGQGASLAIEDAAVLSRCITETPDPAQAFARFVALRRRRAERVVAYGRQIGDRKVASAAGSVFRDLTLPLFLRLGAKAAVEQYGYRV
jgi:FAD-dependent urate hydroxylase